MPSALNAATASSISGATVDEPPMRRTLAGGPLHPNSVAMTAHVQATLMAGTIRNDSGPDTCASACDERGLAQAEPCFAPLLRFLLSTGTRRSEALGLRWDDVNFDRSRITIRRALTKGIPVTPKSGKGRTIAMPPTLASVLFDLLVQRRVEAPHRGWPEVPAWVFCSEAGTPLDESNLSRSWYRVRRRAEKAGVRPLKLHTARHTFASLALNAGRSIRWVAEQLGHSNPELTLRVYAHALPVHERVAVAHGFDEFRDRNVVFWTEPGQELLGVAG